MPADSQFRRLVKRILQPLLPEFAYVALQAPVIASDIVTGAWNEPETDLVSLALRPGETAVDVGANFGMFTWHLSKAVGPEGKVFAFEPLPFTAKVFSSVTRRLALTNVTFFNRGCSDRPGRVSLTVPLQPSGGYATGLAHVAGRADDRPGKETQVRWEATRDVSVELVTLDDCLSSVRGVALIKCDIEGAEPLAFRGAKRMIAESHPTVICEINPWYLEGFGLSLDDLLGPFKALGYQFYRYGGEPGACRLTRVADAEIVEDNYIFIHPSRLERFRPIL